MTDHEPNALEQIRKLVKENPALQKQLQNANDLPAVLDALRDFAEDQGQGLDMSQIAAGLEQLTEACSATRALPDAQLETVTAGVDAEKVLLGIFTLGITAIVDAVVDERRKEGERYGG